MKYRVNYSARKVGAIGVFGSVLVIVDAIDDQDARRVAFDKLHEDGYETFIPIRVTKVEES